MTQEQLKFNPNPLVAFLEKPMSEFTKADILKVIEEFQIEMINFRYMADDGKLHTLNFVIQSLAHADEVLTSGERVDGSSLFPYLEAGNSDLYVIPRFRTAFLDPFTEVPTLDLLCSFYTKDGEPFAMAPEYTLQKADRAFREAEKVSGQPVAIIQHSVKGKGVSFMENNAGWHGKAPNDEQFAQAKQELEAAIKALEEEEK